MEMNQIPTYEAFEVAVTEHFKALNPGMSDKTAEAYIKSEEADFAIKDAYECNKKECEAGKITGAVFMGGGVASVAYCLYMMY